MNGINKDSPVFTNGQISDASGSSGIRFHLNIGSLSSELDEKYITCHNLRLIYYILYDHLYRIAEPHWFHKTTLDREYH